MGSCFPAFFISKAEISRWPFMNWLARLGATIFVDRNQRQQVHFTVNQIMHRLKAGCSVILFPEAQATDGTNILPFKSSHFEAAIETGQPVVPVMIHYHDKNSPSIACWYKITFLTHIIRLLKCQRLDVTVEVLSSFQQEPDRRILARKCHNAILEKYPTLVSH
jgi:1-acyl-sn-glycerol-3-phosphate acyltransferase